MDNQFNDEMLRRIEEHNRRELEKPCRSIQDMLERVEYFALSGDLKQSREWLVTASDQAKDSGERILVLEMMARYEEDHAVASQCYEEAARLTGRSDAVKFAHYFFKAGLEAFYCQNYNRAKEFLSQAVAMEACMPESKTEYLLALDGLSSTCFALSDYEGALSALAQEREQYREDGDFGNFYKASCKIATNFKYLGRYDEALALLKDALVYFDVHGMHLDFVSAKAEYASCCRHAGMELPPDGDFSEKNTQVARRILNEETKNLDNTRKYLGEDQYARSLGVICGTHILMGDRDNSLKFARMYIDTLREVAASRFSFGRFSDRAIFWESHKDYIRQIKRFFSRRADTGGEAATILYDIALLEKGILLKSTIEFQRVIFNNNDETLKELYAQTCKYEEIRRRRPLSIDESMAYEKAHMTLMDMCPELRDYTAYLNCSWQDIQRTVNEKDIAIEFIISQDDPPFLNKTVFAVILTRTGQWPEAIPICSSELITLLVEKADIGEQSNVREFETVWGRISKRLEGKKRVFLSPDGPLCYYGVEYLTGRNGSVADNYEVHRISSTRELWREEAIRPIRSAALFGGASYTTGEYATLYYSMDEVIDIRTIMLEGGVTDVTLFTRNQVTKDAIIGLSGKAPSCIHLAVHGEYTQASADSDGMQNSYLVLSGNETITAEEIAGLDLHDCDLVVLSSCYGSYGKLMDDGVFGLQRAFKNAGVKALLMTTGAIDDMASSLLMKTFYKSLLAGQSCHDAYETARRAVTDKIPGGTGSQTLHRFILLEN